MILLVGSRIGVAVDIGTATQRLVGFGRYAGNAVPPHGLGPVTDMLAVARKPCPKLVLDNGDVVWGVECVWGTQLEIELEMAKRATGRVSIDEVRKAAREAQAMSVALLSPSVTGEAINEKEDP